MNGGAPLVADIESAIAMEPSQGTLDDPSGAAQAAAVGRTAFGEGRADSAGVEHAAMRLRIVRAVALDQAGFAARAPGAAPQGRDGVNERQQLGDVVAVRGGQDRGEGDAARLGQNVMFRPFLAAIGRVRSSFFPPRNARTEALSTMARARSSCPRCRSSANSVVCKRFHTPARCHAARRRQHVLPEPHPISLGSICHGKPERSTKMMPVRVARSSSGRRPARWPRRRRRFGRSGAIRAHSASSISRRWDMAACTKSGDRVQALSY